MEVSRDELAAIRRAADAAPGPSSALAAAVTTIAVHVLSQRKLAWGILAEPVDVDVSASRRQKWIDQSQSLNLYIANPSGKKLDALYRLSWARGLKTTYYLRSRSATHVEKSTLRGTDGKLNSVASVTMMSAASIMISPAATAPDLSGAVACSIDNPECEACQ